MVNLLIELGRRQSHDVYEILNAFVERNDLTKDTLTTARCLNTTLSLCNGSFQIRRILEA